MTDKAPPREWERVQIVPDDCSGITWRGNYYALPLVPPPAPATHITWDEQGRRLVNGKLAPEHAPADAGGDDALIARLQSLCIPLRAVERANPAMMTPETTRAMLGGLSSAAAALADAQRRIERQSTLLNGAVIASAKAEAESAALREQVAVLTADAERYRWLRSHPEWAESAFVDMNSRPLDANVVAILNVSIDAARQPRDGDK